MEERKPLWKVVEERRAELYGMIRPEVREILSTRTLRDFNIAVRKHKGIPMDAFEASLFEAHSRYLDQKECEKVSPDKPEDFVSCLTKVLIKRERRIE